MNVAIDLRVAELLASRLCHDLVGPIGAVNNGLELLEDEADDMSKDALALVMDSAQRAATTLQYFRLAHGMAGSRVGGNLNELRELSRRFLETGKITLDWDDDGAGTIGNGNNSEAPEDLGKLLLNMILLGAEALVGGGAVHVAITDGGPGGEAAGRLRATVMARGDRVALRDETKVAFAESVAVEDLSPRNVQAYFTRLIAQRLRGDLTVEERTDTEVRITATLAGTESDATAA